MIQYHKNKIIKYGVNLDYSSKNMMKNLYNISSMTDNFCYPTFK